MNSQQWWDSYFKKGWKENQGSEQTEGFMSVLVDALPDPELEYIKREHLSIVDWGCALGEGVSVLAKAFPDSEVVGADFSKVAIGRARRRYRKRRFLLTEGEGLPEDFDVIVTSNCLEHFADPLRIVRAHLASCRQLYIVLVPYEESSLDEQHLTRFNEESFPERLEGFERLVNRAIPVDSELWTGDQLLVVYASPDYRGRSDDPGFADVTPIDAAASPSSWARVATATAALQARHEARIDKLGARLEDLQSSHAALRRELAMREHELEERVRFAERLGAHVAELEQKNALQLGEIADRDRRLDTARHDLTHKQRDVEDVKRIVDEKDHWIYELKGQLAQIVETRDALLLQIEEHKNDYREQGARITELQHRIADRERDVAEVQVNLAAREATIVELDAQLAVSTRELLQLGNAVVEARASAEQRERELVTIRAELAQLEQTEADRSARIVELSSWSEVLAGDLTARNLDVDRLDALLARSRDDAGKRQAELREVRKDLELRDRDHREQGARVEALEASLADLQRQRDADAEEHARLEASLAQAARRNDELVREGAEQVADLGQQLLESGRQLASSEQRISTLSAIEESLGARLAERDDEILALGADVAELQRKDAARLAITDELEAEIEANRAVLEDQRVVIEEQANESAMVVAELNASRRAASHHAAEAADLRGRADALGAEVKRLAEALGAANRRATEHAAEAHALFAQLDQIHKSTGWAVLRALMWFRYLLFPSGSWREKLGRRLMHAYRRAASRLRWRSGRRGRSRAEAEAAVIETPVGTELAEPLTDFAGWPLVSVVLPVYNQADLLAESIDSVLAQDYPRFELIVLNDGSTDGVESVLDRYVGDPRVRVLTESNQKLPKALSNAFDLASGTYWTWTSADNLMEPAHLSALVGYLERTPEAAMVYANYLAIDDSGAPLLDPDFRPHNRLDPESPEIHLPHDTGPLNTVKDNFIGACFMYRRDVGKLMGEYDPQLGVEDYDYWMRINQHFEIHHLDSEAMLYRYRVHDNSLNARAADLGIFEAADQLIAYEAERRSASDVPWTIRVDARIGERLAGLDLAPHSVAILDPAAPALDPDVNSLLIVSTEGIGELDAALRARFAIVVAWLCEDLEGVYDNRLAIARHVDLCVAPSRLEAARARLFHDRVVVADSPAQSLHQSLAFAKNERYYTETRSESERLRAPAEVYVPAGHRPRLLVQIDVFAHGGMEQVILDQMVCMRARGFDPVLVTIEREGAAREATAESGIEVMSFEAAADDRVAEYARFLEEHGVDVVISHLSLFGAEAARQRGIPFVQVVHNTYVWFSAEQIRAYREADKYTDAYVCVSAQAARYADLRLGLPAEKLIPLHNGIDTEHFRPRADSVDRTALRERLGLPPKRFVFLNVASIYPPKAQHEMIAAHARVVERHPDALLVFAGHSFDAPFDERVHEQVARLGLSDHVVFAGLQSEILDYYHAADAFLLPSFWEGCSIALMEAALSGLPIIVTRVGSAVDQFDGVPGVTFLDPPFRSITDLDGVNLSDHTNGANPEFVRRIADAMLSVRVDPTPVALDGLARRRFDRRVAYTRHARLVNWIAQGGGVEGARPWLRAFDAAAERGDEE